MQTFGEIIKAERDKKGLFLRQVAGALEVDQALISKFEKGSRKPSKEQVEKFADFFKLDKDILITAWLSDKIMYTIQGEKKCRKRIKKQQNRKLNTEENNGYK